MKNSATAIWKGNGIDGNGLLSTESRVLSDIAFSYHKRIQKEHGTTPEELVAAAQAGCFAMKLAFMFEAAGHRAEEITARCEVAYEAGEVTASHIVLHVSMQGITQPEFDRLVAESGKNCPIAKLLVTPLTIESYLNVIS